MAEAKIEIKVGGVSFAGEGTETWLSSQLDKMLKHLPDLVKTVPAEDLREQSAAGVQKKNQGTLASFLNSKNAKSNKTRKFLATALWLQNGGKKRLTTSEVTKALDDNSQGNVGKNPAQCLVNNVKQGFCEKDGKQFYVTDEGRDEIG